MERNKFYGLICIVFGMLSFVLNNGDATFLILTLIVGGCIYFDKKDVINGYDE